MTHTVAFLRGINLGLRKMKMDELRQSFARAGFEDARTVLASGNVVFEGKDNAATARRIEARLEEDFGFKVQVILRSVPALRQMAATEPFSGYADNADTKFYVFLFGEPEAREDRLPPAVPGDFAIAGTTATEVFAVAYRTPSGRYGPGLDALGKPFGPYVTSRNWNTVLRLIDVE